MKIVVYVAPFPMRTTMQFAEAIGKLENVRLIGVFQQPPQNQKIFSDIILLKNVLDSSELFSALEKVMLHCGRIDRLLGILEQLQEVLAKARERFNISGMRPNIVEQFRDKAIMKQVLEKAGVSCAQFLLVNQFEQLQQFIQKIGFPVVIKPPAGAGAAATYRVNNWQEAEDAWKRIPTRPVMVEEFLMGIEHSLECFVLNGEPIFYSCSRYYPTPLEVKQNPHLQWVVHFPRILTEEKYQKIQHIGRKVIKALGIQTGMTHMEWFFCADRKSKAGRIVVGEIGARPPGAQFTDCTGLVYDMDIHLVWAKLMVDGVWIGKNQRVRSIAAAFLRGKGDGKISSVKNLSSAQEKMGSLVVNCKLPVLGALKSNSYEGDGWVIMAHEDDEVVKRAALDLIRTVEISYQK